MGQEAGLLAVVCAIAAGAGRAIVHIHLGAGAAACAHGAATKWRLLLLLLQVLDVSLSTCTLGRVQLPVHVRVVGSRAGPLEFPIDARSSGPHLVFGPEGVAVGELGPSASVAFDKREVLEEHVQRLQVRRLGCAPMWVCVCLGCCR